MSFFKAEIKAFKLYFYNFLLIIKEMSIYYNKF